MKKRVLAFVWSAAMMGLAFALDYAASSLGVLNLPKEATVIMGLVLAQISKAIRNEIEYRR